MDRNLRSRKTVKVKLNSSSKRDVRKSHKLINNQQTLLATMLALKQNQTIVIAVCRVKNDNGSQETIPIGFKIERQCVPKIWKPYTVHYDNFMKIIIDGNVMVPAMAVASGSKFFYLFSLIEKLT